MPKMLKKFLIYFGSFPVLIYPLLLLAQTVPPGGGTIPNPLKTGGTLLSLLAAILNQIIMPVAAVAVVVWIIWAGFSYLRAQGKPEEIKKANQRLLWSLIGAGILLGAAGISAVIQSTVCGVVATGQFPCP